MKKMKKIKDLDNQDKKKLQKNGWVLALSTLVAGYSLYVAFNKFTNSVQALTSNS